MIKGIAMPVIICVLSFNLSMFHTFHYDDSNEQKPEVPHFLFQSPRTTLPGHGPPGKKSQNQNLEKTKPTSHHLCNTDTSKEHI
ncbi:MAG: hypothetical protein HQL89_02685 [Magnetococcales bacterium]|nr:hypothetical protein [Magnetococcales bacterium]